MRVRLMVMERVRSRTLVTLFCWSLVHALLPSIKGEYGVRAAPGEQEQAAIFQGRQLRQLWDWLWGWLQVRNSEFLPCVTEAFDT